MAALHAFGDEAATTDTWFTIEDKNQYVEGDINSCNDSSAFDLEYFKNDQTFADFTSAKIQNDTETFIQGSYLFEPGFFVGVESISRKNQTITTTIAPGYRYNFNKKNYAAASFDYTSSQNTTEITNFEIEGKYYEKNLKSYGSLSFPKNQSTELNGELDYKISNDLTVGGYLNSYDGTTTIFFGGTYFTVVNKGNKLIIDGMLGSGANTTIFQLSGMYNPVEKFNIGGEFVSSNGSQLTLKANYTLQKVKLVFKYALQSSNIPSTLILAGKMEF